MSNKTQHTTLSLAGHYYTDPDIFAYEQRQLHTSTWQYAGHVSQLKKPGDFFTVTIADESLLCLRDHDENIVTFYNVCQHRAHQLQLVASGNIPGKLLVCPYHAWSYRFDGTLVRGPNIEVVDESARDRVCLTKVRTDVFCGFIFVNLDDSAKPMDEWFPGVRAELSDFVPNIETLAPLEWVAIPESCNWKVSIENYSECYHCALNHPTFSTGVVKPETYDIQPQGYCLRHTTECQNLDSMSYPVDPESNRYAGSYSSWFLWPCFAFQVYPGNVLNTYHWRADSVDKVTVWRGWFTPNGEESSVIRELAIQDRETTVEEDIGLVESVFKGLSSRGYRPGPLVVDPAGGVNSEHSIAALQRWMREAIPEVLLNESDL